MENIVGRASEVLQAMVDDGVTPKLMAYHTGYSRQQTYKYINAECNPTTEFLNLLFRATRDARLVDLITSGTAYVLYLMPPAHAPAMPVDTLKDLIDQRKEEIKREEYLLAVIEDGRVDESDREALRAYNAAFHAANTRDFQIHAAINAAFERATAQGAA